jgi:RNA polymerase sigma-70 factor (ECF subfamily)
MTDLDEFLPAIVGGDADAFGLWVAGAEARLRLSLKSFASYVDVEAVLQETLIRLWQVAPRITPDGRSDVLLRYGVRIARNLAITEMRRLKVHVEVIKKTASEAEEIGRPTGRHPPDPFLRRVIAECKRLLPPKPGQAIAARLESNGRTSDESLAATLGMKLNTFLQNVIRARKLLAECLERHGVNLQEELV